MLFLGGWRLPEAAVLSPGKTNKEGVVVEMGALRSGGGGREGRPGSSVEGIEPESMALVGIGEGEVEAGAETGGPPKAIFGTLIDGEDSELGSCAQFQVERSEKMADQSLAEKSEVKGVKSKAGVKAVDADGFGVAEVFRLDSETVKAVGDSIVGEIERNGIAKARVQSPAGSPGRESGTASKRKFGEASTEGLRLRGLRVGLSEGAGGCKESAEKKTQSQRWEDAKVRAHGVSRKRGHLLLRKGGGLL